MAVQNHIHLDSVLSAAPEYAPVQTWRVLQRKPISIVQAQVRRGLGGRPFAHVVQSAGVPVRTLDFQYKLKLADSDAITALEQLDNLMALQGKSIYLVDNVHNANGADHTFYLRHVQFTQLDGIPNDDLLLRMFFNVNIYLTGLDT